MKSVLGIFIIRAKGMHTTNIKSKIPRIVNFMRLKFRAIGSNTVKQLVARKMEVLEYIVTY